MKRTYSLDEARGIAESLEIDFAKSEFDLEQFRAGLDVEAEHGQVDPETNVTNDDPLTTGKIALAHLNEIPDYYTRLKEMETDAAPTTTLEITSVAADENLDRGLAKRLAIGMALVISGVISYRLFRKGRTR